MLSLALPQPLTVRAVAQSVGMSRTAAESAVLFSPAQTTTADAVMHVARLSARIAFVTLPVCQQGTAVAADLFPADIFSGSLIAVAAPPVAEKRVSIPLVCPGYYLDRDCCGCGPSYFADKTCCCCNVATLPV